MEDFKQKITGFHYGEKSSPLSFLFAVLFFLPSIFYFFIICIKNFLYSVKILKENKVNAFVICVGNLTTGGVGKTPLVIEIANYLSIKGKKVGILSRGYRGKLSSKVPTVIKMPNKILINEPDLIGDEASLISQNVLGASVVICKDRLLGAKLLIEKFGCDTIIMDDGFSNRRIYKNLNIVLVDVKKMFGNRMLLPLGPLREPLFEIKRAQRVVFVNKNNEDCECANKFMSEINIPSLFCRMEKGEIYNIKNGNQINTGAKILAFSGIGSPKQFYDKLGGFEIKKTISFDDHFEYTQKTVDMINSEAKNLNADYIVTTEKDMVKIINFKGIDNFYALKLKPKLNLEELLSE